MKTFKDMKLQIKSAWHATFSGDATNLQLAVIFLLFAIPVVSAVVVYCLTHHLSR